MAGGGPLLDGGVVCRMFADVFVMPLWLQTPRRAHRLPHCTCCAHAACCHCTHSFLRRRAALPAAHGRSLAFRAAKGEYQVYGSAIFYKRRMLAHCTCTPRAGCALLFASLQISKDAAAAQHRIFLRHAALSLRCSFVPRAYAARCADGRRIFTRTAPTTCCCERHRRTMRGGADRLDTEESDSLASCACVLLDGFGRAKDVWLSVSEQERKPSTSMATVMMACQTMGRRKGGA